MAVVASLVCYLGLLLKEKLGYDDSLDAFGIHGLAGIIGAICLTFFIRESWMAEAARTAGGSWTIMRQLVVQCQAVAATIAYTVVVSGFIVVLVDKTIGLRLNENEEKSGMDYSLHGEHG